MTALQQKLAPLGLSFDLPSAAALRIELSGQEIQMLTLLALSAASSATAPAKHAATVTPNDATDLATPARALYIGGEGDVSLDTVGGETVLFSGLAAGFILPVEVKRVRATDTTATVVALW